MFNYFKNFFFFFLCLGIFPAIYAMEGNRQTTILGSTFGLFSQFACSSKNFIQTPFSYLYNKLKLNHYNYTIQGTFNRAKKNNGQFSEESLRAIDQYLEKGLNPDFILEDGKTPFYYFIDKLDKRPQNWNNHDDRIFNKLTSCNANIDFALENGKPPLLVATQAQNLSLVESLLKREDIKVDACDVYGKSTLHYLTDKLCENYKQFNDFDSEIFTELLNSKANPNFGLKISTQFRNTPLIVAAKYKKKLISPLLKSGANVHVIDSCNGETPIAILARKAVDENIDIEKEEREIEIEIFEDLLKHGADSNAKTEDETPILINAIRAGNNELIKLLLDHDANANQRDINRAPLTWAVQCENIEAIKMLCSAGASLVVDSTLDTTIFHLLDDKPEEYYVTIMTHARFDDEKDIVDVNCKNPILAQVKNRIIALKKILEVKSKLSKQTALDRLLCLHVKDHKYDKSFIIKINELLNGTKLDKDLDALEGALVQISSESNNSNQYKDLDPTDLGYILDAKLDKNNLALEMYKNCALLKKTKK